MDQHDNVRERSGSFYGARAQIGRGDPSANVQQNLALRDSLPLFIGQEGFTLLDIGCGGGRVARIVKDVFPRSEIYGIDISPEQIERARLFVSDGVFQVGNEISLPFGDCFFDYATCRMSIHHYPDIMAHLSEVKRALRPGGAYIIIDAIPCTGLQDHWLNEVFLAAERTDNGDGHVKFYTVEEYGRFFEEAGLKTGRLHPLPHSVTWCASTDYQRSIYTEMLRSPEGFRESIAFEDGGDQYRYSLPMHMLSALNPE